MNPPKCERGGPKTISTLAESRTGSFGRPMPAGTARARRKGKTARPSPGAEDPPPKPP